MAFEEGQAAPASTRTGDAKFGEAPLAQTVAAAGAMRRLSSLLLSLEHAHPTVDAMLARFAEWESELAGRGSDGQRAANRRDPRRSSARLSQPRHRHRCLQPVLSRVPVRSPDAEKAAGAVCFPLVYEGPPGLVHGGFLGVFFDCVIQHHNCVTGLSGKTRSLLVTFGRPTPVLTELRFDIARSQVERGIASTARLLLDDEVLCTGEGQYVGVAAGEIGRIQVRQAAKGVRQMTASNVSDDRVLFEVDRDRRIATITLNNPKQRNSYDAAMREAIARCLDRVADDDDLTVVLLRGADGVCSTGADMNNAYGWYGGPAPRQPVANRRPNAAPVSVADSRWTASRLASTTTSWASRRSRWERSPATHSAAASRWR